MTNKIIYDEIDVYIRQKENLTEKLLDLFKSIKDKDDKIKKIVLLDYEEINNYISPNSKYNIIYQIFYKTEEEYYVECLKNTFNI